MNWCGVTELHLISGTPRASITYPFGDAIRFAITYTLRVITYCYADIKCDKSHLIGSLLPPLRGPPPSSEGGKEKF